MPQGGLLGPPADLVDHRVGQPDGVEVVHHHRRMTEWGRQGAGIAAPRVQRDRGDLGQPVAWSGMQPAVDGGSGAVGHQVQQPAALQVDQPGDPPGGRQAGRLEEAGLVQPQGHHPLQASSVID
jgi:hypothetical protein